MRCRTNCIQQYGHPNHVAINFNNTSDKDVLRTSCSESKILKGLAKSRNDSITVLTDTQRNIVKNPFDCQPHVALTSLCSEFTIAHSKYTERELANANVAEKK